MTGRTGDTETDRHVFEVEWDRSESITMAVVEAVAEARGIEETELERVTNRVEPDALDQLFVPVDETTSRDRGSVSFPFAGTDVTVYAHGEIVVSEAE